jgi:hypothetical protein
MSTEDAVGLSDPAFDQPADANYRPNRILGILSPRSINIIAGQARVGKLRLLLSQLHAYHLDNRFLGFTNGQQSPRMGLLTNEHPDRFTATIESLKLSTLNPQSLPVIQSSFDHDHMEPIESAYERFPNHPNLLIVHGLHSFMPSGKISEFGDVRDFCRKLSHWCHEKNVTILATAIMAKQKMGQGYEHVLDRIIGSTNWVTWAGTCIIIDQIEGESLTSPLRKVVVASRDEQWHESAWEFDAGGRLVPSIAPLHWYEQMDKHLDGVVFDQPLRTAELVSWSQEIGIASTSLKQWIRDKIREGDLSKIRKGMYKRPRIC